MRLTPIKTLSGEYTTTTNSFISVFDLLDNTNLVKSDLLDIGALIEPDTSTMNKVLPGNLGKLA